MDSRSPSSVQPGQVLAGKFRIERVLGQGGMGVVVAATHLQLDEKVALKFLLPEALENREAVRRFEREARAAVKIKSEHVARVTDVGTLEDGAPYMVMEFLNGVDLGQYLELTGPLPYEEAVHYLLQACEAIAEAHAAGIVHRDLKPANLFRIIRADGTPSIKVLDFGISKVSSGTESSMTQTSSMMGSPYYMSPEQMTSAKNVDARTDVWALGVILHELLVGKVPYEGDTIPEICVQVLQNPPPQLRSIRPDAPEGLETAINTALAKDREERFDDVAAFSAAISDYGGRESAQSVERIRKVLGVAATERSSREFQAFDATVPGGRVAPAFPANADARARQSTTTLGGAAHSQGIDLPPQTSSKLPLIAVAAMLLLGGGAWAAFGNSGSGQNEETPEAEASSQTPPQTSHDAPARVEAPPLEPELKSEPVPPVPPAPSVETRVVEAPFVQKPAPTPSPRPGPKPSLAASLKPRSQPKPATPPSPAPRPPEPPKPKKSPSSLYLDRK